MDRGARRLYPQLMAPQQRAIVVPFRADDAGHRLFNLGIVLNRLASVADCDIVLVEQDLEPAVVVPDGVRHVLLPDAGPFNKSWAMNVGFRATEADLVAFCDADVLVAASACDRAFAGLSAGYDAVKPFGRIVDLDQEHSALYASSVDVGTTSLSLPDPIDKPLRRGGEYVPFCGGLFMITREAFVAVGGFDERFRGWGAEDDAMQAKLNRFGIQCGILSGQTAYHLWHERDERRYRTSQYQANVDRLSWIRACELAELQQAVRTDAVSMGELPPDDPRQGKPSESICASGAGRPFELGPVGEPRA